jgi:ATP synthase protein I
VTEKNHEGRTEMQETIRKHQLRRERWETEGERPLWKNLSMIGALGWLVVLPTLVGVFVGRWLDGMFSSGVTFSGAFTFVGACLGFWLAWRRMNEE